MRASGRVVLSLTPEANSVNNLPELPLEDGDRFIVPTMPSSVNVVGAVYEQSSFLFDPQRRVFGYLKQAGGGEPRSRQGPCVCDPGGRVGAEPGIGEDVLGE